MPPDEDLHGACDNCGMTRPMWGRTRHTFVLGKDARQTCSIHCLAGIVHNIWMHPSTIVMANYLDPHINMVAENVYYVVGSTMKGLTGKEAFPFAARDVASSFAQRSSGHVGFMDVSVEMMLM